MRLRWPLLSAAWLVLPPLGQVPPAEGVLAETVELRPAAGTAIAYQDRTYLGPLTVVGRPGGLGLGETTSPEDYLLGLREVPFAWHLEALRAQVVAARTYLAYTLAAGRSSTGSLYGYDICATSACQVYAGPKDLAGPYGARWKEAVSSTAGEILLYQGSPAEALYSSTSGGRTRESEDIFVGVDLPYLGAVDSPGEGSPFVTWSFQVAEWRMQALLERAGLVEGELRGLEVETTVDGEGPWVVVIQSAETRRVPTYEFRGMINRAAAELMPEVLPARRGDGGRYPQTLLSGTYLVRRQLRPGVGPGGEKRLLAGSYVFSGWGWGHQVGMSQYGAEAMATAGADYVEILGHYYGGLHPEPAGDWLPDPVVVGLAAGVEEVVLTPDGPVEVVIDGVPIAGPVLGTWTLQAEEGRIRILPPVGLGLPPRIEQPRILHTLTGDLISFVTTAPAEVEISAVSQGEPVGRLRMGGVDAGTHQVGLAELLEGPLNRRLRLEVIIEASNPQGSDRRVLVIVPEIR